MQIINTKGTSLGMFMSRYSGKDRQPGTHTLTLDAFMSHTLGRESIFRETETLPERDSWSFNSVNKI